MGSTDPERIRGLRGRSCRPRIGGARWVLRSVCNQQYPAVACPFIDFAREGCARAEWSKNPGDEISGGGTAVYGDGAAATVESASHM
ncbi:hypothetical protein [Nocardia carnea]|uniref:hypothetical protein n=1 Tax=Nocardia carnea TaxID=37328 RepID=UPI0024558570|nr:hypothetical protein [Nocardia carnea]